MGEHDLPIRDSIQGDAGQAPDKPPKDPTNISGSLLLGVCQKKTPTVLDKKTLENLDYDHHVLK